MRRIHIISAIFASLAISVLPACKPAPTTASTTTVETQLAPTPGKPWFTDVTAASGIDFQHYDSATPLHCIAEVMGSGIGWIDYDGDGWPDLFCVQAGALFPDASGKPPPTHKLYRNNRDRTFTDVTQQVGLDKTGFGMGCAVGDYDNDGFDDLVITYLDHVSLFHNEPDGNGGRKFVDVTVISGLVNPHWGTSCGWADIDNDGLLDLYICNYVQIDLKNYKPCVNVDLQQNYVCPPTVFPTSAHKIYRNLGGGKFTDISEPSGITAGRGAGLGVGLVDLDGDGKVDIYVANDMGPAFVFHNEGNAKFKDIGAVSGAAMMPAGRFMAGMGVAVGDINDSGRPSILVTNFQGEPTMVFLNRGGMLFRDWSDQSGIGPATRQTLGFGVELFDADLDGNLDMACANGHVTRNAPLLHKGPFEQNAQMFLGYGQGSFVEVTEIAGPYFREKHVGRGLAVGDFDNDGRPDLAISHNAGPVRLLRNSTETQNHWLSLELLGDGKKSNRNAIGARVEIEAGGRKLVRWVIGGGSYLSASDRRILAGLGKAENVDRITVVWPSGQKQAFTDLQGDAGWRLSEGREKPEKLPVR